MINGASSVLFDAIILLLNEKNTMTLNESNKKPYIDDFINDAYAHKKFIAYTKDALIFLKKHNILMDDGIIEINNEKDCQNFIEQCRNIRYWKRE